MIIVKTSIFHQLYILHVYDGPSSIESMSRNRFENMMCIMMKTMQMCFIGCLLVIALLSYWYAFAAHNLIISIKIAVHLFLFLMLNRYAPASMSIPADDGTAGVAVTPLMECPHVATAVRTFSSIPACLCTYHSHRISTIHSAFWLTKLSLMIAVPNSWS